MTKQQSLFGEQSTATRTNRRDQVMQDPLMAAVHNQPRRFQARREDAPPRAPHNGTDTSRAAAEMVRSHITRRESWILGLLDKARRNGDVGLTIEQISETPMNDAGDCLPQSSVCPVINTLCKKRYVADSGLRRTTRYGKPAKVWRVL